MIIECMYMCVIADGGDPPADEEEVGTEQQPSIEMQASANDAQKLSNSADLAVVSEH